MEVVPPGMVAGLYPFEHIECKKFVQISRTLKIVSDHMVPDN